MKNFLDSPLKAPNGKRRPPVWFMRQAGRYHQHYQALRQKHSFMELCKNPELACKVTLGPINEFHFDGAILFSDLLFPLEQLGMGLSYESGPPTLEFHLDHVGALSELEVKQEASTFYLFQKKALTLLKKALPPEVTLLGFVGAPFTLFAYACQGGHHGNLTPTKIGLYDGRYEGFLDLLMPNLLTNISLQAEGGAEVICLFDTAAGELGLQDFSRFCVPPLEKITKTIKSLFPKLKLQYFSKNTHLEYLRQLEKCEFDIIGVDWRFSMKEILQELGPRYYIQGNIDPSHLFLSWNDLQENLKTYKEEILQLPVSLQEKLIINLGHGVYPKTPEKNVYQTVQYLKDFFKV